MQAERNILTFHRCLEGQGEWKWDDMFYRRASGGAYERAENNSSACDGLVGFKPVPKCSNLS